MRPFLIPVYVAALALPLGAAATQPVDYVYDYNGPASAYSVQRDGQELKLIPLLPLAPGDRVTVKAGNAAPAPGSKSYIALAIEHQTVTLHADSPSYCVGSPNGDCSKRVRAQAAPGTGSTNYVGNILSYLGSILAGPHDDKLADQTESMLSRGPHGPPPIAIPLLARNGQRVVAGNRRLTLEWGGGTPPFDVALYGAGNGGPLVTQRFDARTAAFPALTLVPGAYRFEIVDREKQSAIGGFSVVPESELPKPDADDAAALADPSLTPEIRTTLEAALLLRSGAEWNLEAYERVAPLAATCPPAELLRYKIADDE